VTLGLIAFAVWMIVSTWLAPGMVIICTVILLVGFEVRPRIPNVPKDVLNRLRFPRLFGLTDQVSAEMGTRPVAGILITPRFTAGVARTGLLRRPYLEIGLPLFMILDPQERVALLSHEMGHLVNGDPGRSLIIATALESLVTWAYLLVPGRGAPRARPASTFMLSGAIAQRFAEMASKIMMVFAGAVAWMMVHLSWRDSQRAEYLADHLAAEVAGSAGTTQMLRKLEFVDVFDGSVESAGIRSLTGAQMMDEFSADIAAHPVASATTDRGTQAPHLETARIPRPLHGSRSCKLVLRRRA
jgi:Zn-dependent protease with chaperone function